MPLIAFMYNKRLPKEYKVHYLHLPKCAAFNAHPVSQNWSRETQPVSSCCTPTNEADEFQLSELYPPIENKSDAMGYL
eukprot:6754850-Ditylum_brightwellii.AAC.1